MPRALIFANGDLVSLEATRAILQPGDVIIAADGGARQARALGINPSVIIGDFDSLSADEIRFFEGQGVQLQRYPPAKDETDLELALFYALRAGYCPILILGAFGGRLDQALGNIALLSDPEALQTDVRLEDGLTEAFFIRERAVIHGAPGDTVSFIPWGAPAEGVSTGDLLYPLRDESLYPYRTRSISNQMLAHTASVSLKHGLLLCIHIRKN